MATELAKAYVQIVPSAEGISSGIESIMNGSDVTSAANKSGSSIGSTIVKGIGASFVAGTTAVVGAAASMWKGINETAAAGDAIDKTSQKLGVTTDQYQAMAFAAEHCGFSTSVLDAAQKKLASSDFNGNVYDAIGYIQSLGTEEERTAAASELFGAKAAQQMQPLINGSQTIDEYSQQLSDLGGMMSGEAVAASAAFEDAMTDLQTSISGAKNGIMAEFLPGVTDVVGGLSMLFSGDSGAAGQISKGLESVAENFTEIIPTIVSTLQGLLPSLLSAASNIIVTLAEGLISAIPQLIPAATNIIIGLVGQIVTLLPQIISMGVEIIVQLALGIAQALPELIPAVIDAILTISENLIDNIDLIVDAAIAIIVGLATGLVNALPKLVEKAPTIIIKLVQALSRNIPKLLQAAVDIIMMLGKGLIDNIPVLVQKAPEIIDGIKNALSDGISKIVDIGKNIVEGLWNGINDKVEWLKEKISGFASSALNAIKDFFGIHSPSKVMRDEVGKWIPEGMAIGITANADSVYSAMDKIGNGMLDTNITGNIQSNNIEDMLYRAFSMALSDHKISFNDRELGRLVRSYA